MAGQKCGVVMKNTSINALIHFINKQITRTCGPGGTHKASAMCEASSYVCNPEAGYTLGSFLTPLIAAMAMILAVVTTSHTEAANNDDGVTFTNAAEFIYKATVIHMAAQRYTVAYGKDLRGIDALKNLGFLNEKFNPGADWQFQNVPDHIAGFSPATHRMITVNHLSDEMCQAINQHLNATPSSVSSCRVMHNAGQSQI